MKKFNIEAARLNGWVKSPKEAATEMSMQEAEVERYYGVNHKLKSIRLIEGAA